MATIQLDATQIFIYGTLWAGFWALVGWFANFKVAAYRLRIAHQHALDDARADRIREFKGYMSGFRSWVERSSIGEVGEGFHDMVHRFRVASALVRDDLPKDQRSRFDELVDALCRLTASDVSEYAIEGGNANYIGQNRLCNAIDRVREMFG